MSRPVRWILSCCMVAGALACGSDDSGSDSDKVTFTKDIHPLFEANCTGSFCHDMVGSFLPGHALADVNVAYTEATRVGSGGAPVYQLILQRVSSVHPGEAMPPTCGTSGSPAGLGQPGCLTQAQYDLIKTWVDEGRSK